jgi:hypothetical protein
MTWRVRPGRYCAERVTGMHFEPHLLSYTVSYAAVYSSSICQLVIYAHSESSFLVLDGNLVRGVLVIEQYCRQAVPCLQKHVIDTLF